MIEFKTGGIPLLAVNRKFRDKSVGSMIYKRLKEATEASSLSVLNIPSDCDYKIIFYKNIILKILYSSMKWDTVFKKLKRVFQCRNRL